MFANPRSQDARFCFKYWMHLALVSTKKVRCWNLVVTLAKKQQSTHHHGELTRVSQSGPSWYLDVVDIWQAMTAGSWEAWGLREGCFPSSYCHVYIAAIDDATSSLTIISISGFPVYSTNHRHWCLFRLWIAPSSRPSSTGNFLCRCRSGPIKCYRESTFNSVRPYGYRWAFRSCFAYRHQPGSQIITLRFLLRLLANYHHRLKKLSRYALGKQSMKGRFMTDE